MYAGCAIRLPEDCWKPLESHLSTSARSLIFHPEKLLVSPPFLQSKTFMVFVRSRVTAGELKKESRFIALSVLCLPHQMLSHASSDAASRCSYFTSLYPVSLPLLLLRFPLVPLVVDSTTQKAWKTLFWRLRSRFNYNTKYFHATIPLAIKFAELLSGIKIKSGTWSRGGKKFVKLLIRSARTLKLILSSRRVLSGIFKSPRQSTFADNLPLSISRRRFSAGCKLSESKRN